MSINRTKDSENILDLPIGVIVKAFLKIGVLTFIFHCTAFAGESVTLNKTLRFGILPDSSQNIIDSRFTLLFNYIKRETGIEAEYVKATDYQNLVELFIEKKIDLAFFGGYTFIKAQINAGAIPLVMRDIDLRFSTVFIVRSDNKKTKLEDFKGSTLSLGSKLSTSGHLMPRYFLTERKINPDKFFAKVIYSGSHDKTAFWVRDGQVELGAANSTLIRKMFKDGDLKHSDIRILWETPAYSNYVWAIQPDYDTSLRNRLLDIFLSLSPLDPEQKKILSAWGASGFLPANNADFDSLRKVIQQFERK